MLPAVLEAPATDPRILRSRRMLLDALDSLLTQKPYQDISIQEIADQSTLSRGTFYLHYPDKDALLKALTHLRFRRLLDRRGVSFTGCEGTLRAIALGVCDYLTDTVCSPVRLTQLPVEGSIIAVTETLLYEGLQRKNPVPEADPLLLAATGAWAIFGAARTWFLTPNRVPAEIMASQIAELMRTLFLRDK